MGRNMHIDKFWEWVRKTFTVSYQQEIERYFKDCVDHADVERVMYNLRLRGML